MCTSISFAVSSVRRAFIDTVQRWRACSRVHLHCGRRPSRVLHRPTHESHSYAEAYSHIKFTNIRREILQNATAIAHITLLCGAYAVSVNGEGCCLPARATTRWIAVDFGLNQMSCVQSTQITRRTSNYLTSAPSPMWNTHALHFTPSAQTIKCESCSRCCVVHHHCRPWASFKHSRAEWVLKHSFLRVHSRSSTDGLQRRRDGNRFQRRLNRLLVW